MLLLEDDLHVRTIAKSWWREFCINNLSTLVGSFLGSVGIYAGLALMSKIVHIDATLHVQV